jgi:dipeptidyl aminopeptidase/acylaminoacyl peptidase
VVAPDGSRRRIGAYAGASWSPHGRFVVAWRDGELLAVEPGGRVRWSLARPERITAARWNAVDGFRIAYVTGRSLRVVGGDGAGDRLLGTAGGAALAWRPDDDHVLAYVDGLRRPTVEAVDSGRVLWSGDPLGDGPVELAWSPDGRRLLVATARAWLVVGRDGRERGWQPVREGFAVDDVAWAPRGDRFVVVRRNERRSDITLVGPRSRRLLFTGAGRFGPVAFSPDGRRLLVPSPGADQWLFLETGAAGGVTAVANIGRQFARGPGPAAFPDAVEWGP